MRKFILSLLICIVAFCVSVASAEIKSYEGIGESVMSERETAAIAKDGARLQAIRNAQEQAGFFVSSLSIMKNNELPTDEIVAFTASIVKISGEVKYEPVSLGDSLGTIMYRAKVVVMIDTDEMDRLINQWLNRNSQERSTITAQNNELVKAVDDVKAKNEEVKTLIATAKTPQDNAKIQEELKSLDRATLYAQKISDGNNYFKSGNSEMAQKLYQEAIELYPNDATIAYEKMGDLYRISGNYDKAIDSYNKVIQMDSNYSVPYYKRGAIYYFLKDYEKASKDLEIARQNSTNSRILNALISRIQFKTKNHDENISKEDLAKLGLHYLQYSNDKSIWGILKDNENRIEFEDEHKSVIILAVDEISKALEKNNPDYYSGKILDYECYFYRAEAYNALENFEMASENYRLALIGINSINWTAYHTCIDFGFKTSLKPKKDVVQILFTRMAQCYEKIKDYDKAELARKHKIYFPNGKTLKVN